MMFLVSILALVLPVSFSIWFVNFISSDVDSPSPVRWLFSLLFPLIVATYGYRRKSLNMSGALTGILLSFLLTISNLCFVSCLLMFFLSSSKATKFHAHKKRRIEADFKEGGQRNWVQVICNGGVAAQVAVLFMIQRGFGENVLDFRSDYTATWLSISVMASLASANGDTWASELATVLSKQEPRLITTLERVPKGTNGGVTLVGLAVSILGGGAVGVAYYLCQLLCLSASQLEESVPQWPVLLVAAFAGLFGSVVDSLLGATLQFSGLDSRSRKVVERPGPKVQWISGVAFLDNHSVNLLSSLTSAMCVPFLAVHIWDICCT